MTPVLYAFPDDGDATLDAVLDSLPDGLRYDVAPTVLTDPDEPNDRYVLVHVEAATEWGYSAFALAAHGRSRLLGEACRRQDRAP